MILEGDVARLIVPTLLGPMPTNAVMRWCREEGAYHFMFEADAGFVLARPLPLAPRVIGSVYDNPKLLDE
jgi:hypothetical protein